MQTNPETAQGLVSSLDGQLCSFGPHIRALSELLERGGVFHIEVGLVAAGRHVEGMEEVSVSPQRLVFEEGGRRGCVQVGQAFSTECDGSKRYMGLLDGVSKTQEVKHVVSGLRELKGKAKGGF